MNIVNDNIFYWRFRFISPFLLHLFVVLLLWKVFLFLAPKPTPPPICNADLTAANGTISSPGYPAPYKKNLNCTTRITAPVGMRVHVIFTAFDMYARFCEDDYVQIINGAFSRRYCGTISPPPITSKTNELTIRFITDSYSYGSNGGYLATYKTVDGKFITLRFKISSTLSYSNRSNRS